MSDARIAVVTAFGIGVALASAPGAVQAVLLSEAMRGGLPAGLRALFGSSVTFAFLLISVALGLSFLTPSGAALQTLKLAGAGYLLWLAADAFRSAAAPIATTAERARVPAVARGSLAILLNPGGWVFLSVVASPLLATAAQAGGIALALTTAAALVVGASLGDAAIVALGAFGIRRAGNAIQTLVRRVLAALLAALALLLLLSVRFP